LNKQNIFNKKKKILKLTRGYYGSRKNVWTVAKNTWEKGLTYAYRDRKNNKRNFRALWIQRINAAARLEGMSYSKLMGALHKAGIEINRKVLADLAMIGIVFSVLNVSATVQGKLQAKNIRLIKFETTLFLRKILEIAEAYFIPNNAFTLFTSTVFTVPM